MRGQKSDVRLPFPRLELLAPLPQSAYPRRRILGQDIQGYQDKAGTLRRLCLFGWTPEFQKGDAVLNPAQINKVGLGLGKNPDVVTIDNGMHNLILSSDTTAREAAYLAIFNFLRKY